MRKIVVIALLFASFALYAQDEATNNLKSKNGKLILPQQGDIGFGIEGTQFVNFIGNLFNEAGTNTLNLNLPANTQTFCLKLVKDQNTFYRGKLRIGYISEKEREYIQDADHASNPEKTVEDEFTQKQTNIELAFGIEKRKGINRLQGFYGFEAGFGISNQKYVYEYGNELDADVNLPMHSTNFGNNIDFSTNPDGYPMRALERKVGTTFAVRSGLFIGGEYFFAPKLSFAGEFGWNIIFTSQGEGNTTYEYFDLANTNDKEFETKTAGESSFYIDNTPTGLLTLNLYF